MKKVFALLMLFASLCALPALAATTTLTGTVTDDMCGAGKHMMPGKSDAVCIRACVKSGAKYALADGAPGNDLTGGRIGHPPLTFAPPEAAGSA